MIQWGFTNFILILSIFYQLKSFTSSHLEYKAQWTIFYQWRLEGIKSMESCCLSSETKTIDTGTSWCSLLNGQEKNCKLCKPADPATFGQSLSEQSLHLECDRLDLNQFRLRHATIWKQHQNNTTFFSIQTCSKCIQHMTLWERNVRRLLSEKVTAGSEWCSNAAILLSCWLRSFCRIQRQIQALSKARRLWIGNNAGTRQFTPQVTCEHAHSMCQRAVWYMHL